VRPASVIRDTSIGHDNSTGPHPRPHRPSSATAPALIGDRTGPHPRQHPPSSTTTPVVIHDSTGPHPRQHRPSSTTAPAVIRDRTGPHPRPHRPSSTTAPAVIHDNTGGHPRPHRPSSTTAPAVAITRLPRPHDPGRRPLALSRDMFPNFFRSRPARFHHMSRPDCSPSKLPEKGIAPARQGSHTWAATLRSGRRQNT
jgi:hypothetical protein